MSGKTYPDIVKRVLDKYPKPNVDSNLRNLLWSCQSAAIEAATHEREQSDKIFEMASAKGWVYLSGLKLWESVNNEFKTTSELRAIICA